MPLDEYRDNLRAIVQHLQQQRVPAIVLITPPPISEPDRIVHVLKVRLSSVWKPLQCMLLLFAFTCLHGAGNAGPTQGM